jgi:hypothetical protein
LAVLLTFFIGWLFLDKPPLAGDWQEQLAVVSTAEFQGDQVTVKNVRNFRYGPAIRPASGRELALSVKIDRITNSS